jgi:type II secretory pathway component GspD/PulD (secretin)
VIKGLVYTANENLLRDVGVQTSITTRTGNGNTQGGIFSRTAGGIGSLFDFSAIIGTTTFSVEANLLEQQGVIAIKSRPFAVVLDGDETALEVGRQIPVLTQGSVIGTSAGNLEFIGASNLLKVTPHVIDDENGNPVAVNLEMQIESNEVDTTVISQDLPAITRRSIQSRLILNQDKTVILGGFTVDSSNRTVSKTPGLGDIPLLGYLFKRKIRSDQINRLYFALSASIVPYGSVIEPVVVPGATTDIPSITPEMLKRSKPAPTVDIPPVKENR